MSKPKMVTIEASLLRKMVRLIKRQQKCLEQWVEYAKKQRHPVERTELAITPAAATAALKLYRREKR